MIKIGGIGSGRAERDADYGVDDRIDCLGQRRKRNRHGGVGHAFLGCECIGTACVAGSSEAVNSLRSSASSEARYPVGHGVARIWKLAAAWRVSGPHSMALFPQVRMFASSSRERR